MLFLIDIGGSSSNVPMHSWSLPVCWLQANTATETGQRGYPTQAAHKPQASRRGGVRNALCLGFQPSLGREMWNKDGLILAQGPQM